MNPDLTALYKKQYETLTDRLTKMDMAREGTTPEAMKRVSVGNRVELENPMTRIEAGMNIGNTSNKAQVQSMQLQMEALNNLRDQLLKENETNTSDTLSQADLQSEYLKGNKRVKYDPTTKSFSIDTEPNEESTDVDTWVKSIKDGLVTIKDVPDANRMEVLQKLSGAGYKTEEQKKADAQKQESVGLVDELLNSDLAPVTGTLRLRSKIEGTAAFNTAKKVQQLKDQLALDKRQLLKGSGQISDKESQMLADAVTALDPGMSEEAFRNELMKIKKALTGQGFKPIKETGVIEDVGNWLLGGAKNTLQDIVAGSVAGNKGRQANLAQADAMATKLEEQAMATNDMKARMESLKRANEIRQSISQTAGEMSSKFSKDVNRNPFERSVEASSQIIGTAGLVGGVANKVLPSGPLTKPLGPFAGKASLTDTASKGVDKVKQFVNNKDGFDAAVKKAGNLKTKSVVEAGEKYVKNDPFAKEAWKQIKPSLGNKTSARELLDKMFDVWSGAYDKSGDVRSKANAALYNKLYGAARRVIADQAPEVSKKIAWNRFVKHQLPETTRKLTWLAAKLGLAKGIL